MSKSKGKTRTRSSSSSGCPTIFTGAICWDDPGIHDLARSIKEYGLREPILISRDEFIISGHRRRIAAYIAKLDLVPVRIHSVSRAENPDAFIKLLVEMNSQRIKTTSVS